jgi:ADP-ribosyl-[dinitrogen reductase] hydrolase
VVWFNSHPPDMGNATRRAFNGCLLSQTPQQNYMTATKNSKKLNMEILSNGCLMRISPLGIASLHLSHDQLHAYGRLDCQITNPNQITQDATCAYLSAIKTALETGSLQPTIQSSLRTQNPIVNHIIQSAINATSFDLVPMFKAGKYVMIRPDSAYQGYFGIALFCAFYEISHAKSFMDMMKDIMIHGGDTDTNCAIAGALYGALNGGSHIPKHLIKEIITHPYVREKVYPWGQTSDLLDLAMGLSKLNLAHDKPHV